MSISLNTHTQEYGLKSLEGVCSTFEMVHKSHILRNRPYNASTELLGCFHKLNALESNKIAELLLQYYPLPRGTALAYLPWQIAEPAHLRSSFCKACISLLPQHEFQENAGSAQPFIPPWYISYSSPTIPSILFPCHSKVWEINFPFLILPLPQLSLPTSLHHISVFYPNLQALLMWLSALDATWSCLDFFVSILTSPKALFANTIWSFLLPKFQSASWELPGLKAALHMRRCNTYSILLW